MKNLTDQQQLKVDRQQPLQALLKVYSGMKEMESGQRMKCKKYWWEKKLATIMVNRNIDYPNHSHGGD